MLGVVLLSPTVKSTLFPVHMSAMVHNPQFLNTFTISLGAPSLVTSAPHCFWVSSGYQMDQMDVSHRKIEHLSY